MRGFGVIKSVLIVDEVHAYDQYMYGLLDSVIKQQALAGGSAILLSATLPSSQRQALISAWTQTYVVSSDAPYPLITSVDLHGQQQHFVLIDEQQQPLPRTVFSTTYVCQDAYPDDALLQQVIMAVEQGALVGIVCNLVDHAQALANYLRRPILLALIFFMRVMVLLIVNITSNKSLLIMGAKRSATKVVY